MLTQAKNSDGQRHMAADKTLARLIARSKEKTDGRQSEAFVWLRLRFLRLSPRLRTGPGWRGVAEEMAADGIKGGKGRPLTDQAVRRIWSRVCQAVAAEKAARVNAKRLAPEHGEPTQKPRSREPERGANADRPPPIVTTPTPPPPVPYYPPPPSSVPSTPSAMQSRPHETLSDDERTAQAMKEIAHLRRLFRSPAGYDPDKIE